MRRIRIIGACLVATLAIGALGAGTASAQPTYKTCIKASPKGSGKWNTRTCTGESKGGEREGDYELGAWNAGRKTTFTGRAGPFTYYSYIKGFGVVGTVTCAKAKVAGEITGPSTGTEVITLEKCTTSGETCTSAGAPKTGDVVTAVLNTELAELGGGAVAVRVKGVPVFSESKCGADEWIISGAIDGDVSGDVNTVSKDLTQDFGVNAGGEQQISEEGDVLIIKVVGVGEFETGVENTMSIKGEAMEIET